MKKVTFAVKGMSCEHCAAAVTAAAKSAGKVQCVKVDVEGGKVSLQYDSEKTTLEKIKAAISDAGYETAA